jgi:hypothetical protein
MKKRRNNRKRGKGQKGKGAKGENGKRGKGQSEKKEATFSTSAPFWEEPSSFWKREDGRDFRVGFFRELDRVEDFKGGAAAFYIPGESWTDNRRLWSPI